MADLVVLVPVLRRPQNVAPLLESIAAATSEPHRVGFIPDPDDDAERDAINEAGGEIVCELKGGYAAKINAGVRLTDEPLILLAADDLRFHVGWFENARRLMQGPVGVVGTNDLGNARVMRGEHATHPLVARWYAEKGTIDDPGRVLHEEYPHEFVDDEFIQTAQHRGAYAHAHDSIVEHLHPLWGKADSDELYAAHEHRMRQGRVIFNRRRPLWT